VFGIGAVLVLQGNFTPGAMIAVSILTGRALAPIDGAVGAWRTGIQARDAWRRIQQLLADAPQALRALALPRPDGDLEITEVSYVYPGLKEPALRNVSFRLPKGQSLAIVGPAASGKTTLARLIVGNLVPGYGHARLAGIELARWAPEDKGNHVGYLAQDVELFPATVRENITRLADTPEGVVEAAQLIGAEDMIARLPQRYDTPVGPRGAALSGGQRQWLGLARAVWGSPCLVVLDEPNSNLDAEAEAALIEGLARLKERGTTVVLVTHRPAMLQQVDHVLVMRAGGVQAFGPRGTILPRLISPAAKLPSAGA
jgi:PrtD family type I secretion system ABC transporter